MIDENERFVCLFSVYEPIYRLVLQLIFIQILQFSTT